MNKKPTIKIFSLSILYGAVLFFFNWNNNKVNY